MLTVLDDFKMYTGPAPWDRFHLTHHTASAYVKQLHGREILRRVLLFRKPVDRMISMWRYSSQRGLNVDFNTWMEGITPIDGLLPQVTYCRDHDAVIRTEYMVEDIEKLFGVRVELNIQNISTWPKPTPTEDQIQKLINVYWEDVELAKAVYPSTESVVIHG